MIIDFDKYPRHAANEAELRHRTDVAFDRVVEVIPADTFGPDTTTQPEGFVAPNLQQIYDERQAELDEIDAASQAAFDGLLLMRPHFRSSPTNIETQSQPKGPVEAIPNMPVHQAI